MRLRWKMSSRFDDLKARLQGTAPVERWAHGGGGGSTHKHDISPRHPPSRYKLRAANLRVMDDDTPNQNERYDLEPNSFARGRMKL